MKKQKGFTLIELMVVMAIIAILATAGLSAYTGYIKKARDATRLADIQAINTIVLGSMASTGLPPADIATLITFITAANNGTILKDPLTEGTTFKSTCLSSGSAACVYMYKTCNSGTQYNIAGRFESTANLPLYTSDSGDNGDLYEVGSCTASPVYVTTGTDDIIDNNTI